MTGTLSAQAVGEYKEYLAEMINMKNIHAHVRVFES